MRGDGWGTCAFAIGALQRIGTDANWAPYAKAGLVQRTAMHLVMHDDCRFNDSESLHAANHLALRENGNGKLT